MPRATIRPLFFVASALGAAALLGLAVAACVGDAPAAEPAPAADGGTPPASTLPASTNDAATTDTGTSTPPSGSGFCASVPPATSAKETVFCEDFETDYTTRWTSSSANGTIAVTDVGGYKALDVTLNATAADDYTGPRLLWRKIPSGGAAEVTFDFMLVEAPTKPALQQGLLWFARIGSFGSASIGFGAELIPASVDYAAIVSGGPGDVASDSTFTFAPNEWVPVTMRYTSTAEGSDQFVKVGTNPEYASSLSGGDVALLADDVVFLGVFAKGAPAVARARFAKVVIRVTTP